MCFLAPWAGCVRGHRGNPHRLLLTGEGLSEAPDPAPPGSVSCSVKWKS